MTNLILLATASCLMISEPDQRAYCKALESRHASDCTAITNFNLRQRCRVELGDNVAHCMTISDRAERALCQTKATKAEQHR